MKQWQKTLIGPDASIRETIAIIDSGTCQIALVVDDEKRLLGTVTDGDVRRGILAGVSLDSEVQNIMNSQPVTVGDSAGRADVLNLLQVRRVMQAPRLDSEGRVIGLEILRELLNAPRSNRVVLMAGGLGRRLMPLTEECPKPLLKVGDKPILEHIIENLSSAGFRNLYVSVFYKSEMIKDYFSDGRKWNVAISYLEEDRQMGTAGALSHLPDGSDEPVIVMNADLLTTVNFDQLLAFHKEQKAQATMCVREHTVEIPYGVVELSGHTIDRIDEKPDKTYFINTGIYVLEPEMLSYIETGSYLNMPTLFDRLLEKKFKCAAFPLRESWIDIGHQEEYRRAQNSEIALGGKSQNDSVDFRPRSEYGADRTVPS